ncbi:MAG: type III-A CRISPR-associated protein Csm2 [candidate division WOR-3 bacterium]|nr:type III-A CRISPR-associated protein Csm2 [Candidatus Omnitrophota bacterium]
MQKGRNSDDFIKENDLQRIIRDGDAEILNNYAEELGRRFKDKLRITDKRGKERSEPELSTSQIRNILDEIQRISGKDFQIIKNRLHLLRPKLAYTAGRHGGRVKEFRKVVEKAITLIEDLNHFRNFRNFIEAIVAYHRYYGGE